MLSNMVWVRLMNGEEAPLEVTGVTGTPVVRDVIRCAKAMFKLKDAVGSLRVQYDGVPLAENLPLSMIKEEAVLHIDAGGRKKPAAGNQSAKTPSREQNPHQDEEASDDDYCRSPSPVPVETLNTGESVCSEDSDADPLSPPCVETPCDGAYTLTDLIEFPSSSLSDEPYPSSLAPAVPLNTKRVAQKHRATQHRTKVHPVADAGGSEEDDGAFDNVLKCFQDMKLSNECAAPAKQVSSKTPARRATAAARGLTVEQAYQTDRMEELTVATLSAFLVSRGLSGKGTKKALIQRIGRFAPVFVKATPFAEVETRPSF
ncbi:hypothetical protein DIPPA_28152 [Diplonema papillatum]|nr:hypothetical protein DIPPA_28152 [Diplonema papillatum]